MNHRQHASSISFVLPLINEGNKTEKSLNNRILEVNKKSYKDFLKNQPEAESPKKIRIKRKYRLFGSGKCNQKLPSFYDRRLLAKTPDPERSKDFYEFLGRSKEEIEEEKNSRLEDLKKRKYDADTAIFSSLSHKIERFGKKVLISSKGVKS